MRGTDRREKYRVGSDLSSLENGGELVHTINYSNDGNHSDTADLFMFFLYAQLRCIMPYNIEINAKRI
jgi:endo-alpha-1,4-polygalactosaminidase (GH114 family)